MIRVNWFYISLNLMKNTQMLSLWIILEGIYIDTDSGRFEVGLGQ